MGKDKMSWKGKRGDGKEEENRSQQGGNARGAAGHHSRTAGGGGDLTWSEKEPEAGGAPQILVALRNEALHICSAR